MKDIYDFVWKPTVQGKNPPRQMMIQREYLLTICKAAGLKYAGTGAPCRSLRRRAGRGDRVRSLPSPFRSACGGYQSMTDNLCY